MKRLLTIISLFIFSLPARADEGMWLPALIEGQLRDMRERGFQLRADDLYSPAEPSLSDAIVLFGRGCTGAIVSAEGLLFTNHHCGYGQIQSHSTLSHDYLTDGFWAMNREEELPNPGLEVKIMVRMEDVTEAVNEGRRDELIREAEQGGRYRADIKPLYFENQHWMWVYEVFTDVRLVAAPPSSIGKFGGDTDNWMWPRHTGDFSVFRIYAGPDNLPADYSPGNVPYRPARFFTVSDKGYGEGDFTFVYGFPGVTHEYIISDAVEYIVDRLNPMRTDIRTGRLEIINAASQADPAVRIKYASKQAVIANSWKRWLGESRGLQRRGTVGRKRHYEEEFRRWAHGIADYNHLLDSMKAAYADWEDEYFRRDLFRQTFDGIELTEPAQIAEKASGRLTPEDEQKLSAFYKDYDPGIDRRMTALMLDRYTAYSDPIPHRLSHLLDSLGSPDAVADWIFENSSFVTPEGFRLAAADSVSLARAVAADPLLGLRREAWDAMDRRLETYPTNISAIPDIARWYGPYMRALMEFDPDRRFYPDANLTLRIAYGEIEGYRYEDAVWHDCVTTIDGIIEKDDPEIYDYDIPEKLREIYAARDFGRWTATIDGRETVPVCFIASNHTSGGNSGSPILNGCGELLGLNFDRTWLSTMSDIEFDPLFCRNISVDIRYVLFVIEKIGGAGWIIDELDFGM